MQSSIELIAPSFRSYEPRIVIQGVYDNNKPITEEYYNAHNFLYKKKEYFYDGRTRSETYYNYNGTYMVIDYYQNGRMRQEAYYNKDRKLHRNNDKAIYINEHLPALILYDQNGIPEISYYYKDGKHQIDITNSMIEYQRNKN